MSRPTHKYWHRDAVAVWCMLRDAEQADREHVRAMSGEPTGGVEFQDEYLADVLASGVPEFPGGLYPVRLVQRQWPRRRGRPRVNDRDDLVRQQIANFILGYDPAKPDDPSQVRLPDGTTARQIEVLGPVAIAKAFELRYLSPKFQRIWRGKPSKTVRDRLTAFDEGDFGPDNPHGDLPLPLQMAVSWIDLVRDLEPIRVDGEPALKWPPMKHNRAVARVDAWIKHYRGEQPPE